MAHVDALSRAVTDDDLTTEAVDAELAQQTCVFIAISVIDKVRFMQQGDPETRELIQQLEQIGLKTKQVSGDIEHYEVINGILHHRYDGRLLLVVPKAMRKGIVIVAHDYGGHFALDRTVAKISKDFWFSRLRRYVRQHQYVLGMLNTQKTIRKVTGPATSYTSGKETVSSH
uniref:Integrase zinc-binding domain-containing protein n=1 Tax=Schizaphis graminum TaxID=13262 RepID=A0A2S2NQB9_SCHGA